jgi:hypothetical protein
MGGMETQYNQEKGQANAIADMNYTPEQSEAIARYTRSITGQMETNMARNLDAILSGATGNATRQALMKSHEMIGQINDARIQADAQTAAMMFNQKLEIADRTYTMWQDAIARGDASVQDFMAYFQKNREDAMTGYATQIATLVEQNKTYLDMYAGDLDRIRTAADLVFNSVQVETGLDQSIFDRVQQEFDNYLKQYWADQYKISVDALKEGNKTAAEGAVYTTIMNTFIKIATMGLGGEGGLLDTLLGGGK